jgi:SAM-dependent methyltransferase
MGGTAGGIRLLSAPASRRRGWQRVARGMNNVLTRLPSSWRLLRAPMRRFFDRAAPGWDARYASDPSRLVPLETALALLPRPPARVLDVGTGTGVAALAAAARWPEAEVLGIDVSPSMIALAAAKETRPGVRFLVADVAELERGDGYDLVMMVNMPPFTAQVASLLRPGGYVAHVASRGPVTPFYTPAEKLDRGYRRHGLQKVASGSAGPGTYYLAQRP